MFRMKRRIWLTKEVLAWAFFDFANQSYTIVILTAMFPVYFSKYIVPGGGNRGEQLWATCGMITQAIIILTSPIIGALADFSGAKKKWLFLTYALCVLLTAAMGLVTPGQVLFGSLLFISSYLFYGAGENFLSAFLPELARDDDMGKVSGFSWALAYCGSLLALGGAAIIFMLVAPDKADAHVVGAFRLSCVWAAVFFLIAGIPIFVVLKERKQREQMPAGQTILTVGFHRLAQTFREIRGYQMLFRYLAIMSFFFAGVQTVYWFSGIMAREHFHFREEKMIFFLMVVTVPGVMGAALTARYQDRIGTRRTIMICLAYWTFVMIVAALARTEWLFWVVGNLAGFGLGALGTSTRVMVGLFSPQHKAGEFFGFWGIAHKLAAIIGLGSTNFILHQTENRSIIIACNAVFFAVGFFLMFLIDEQAGRERANRAALEHIRKHHDYVGELEGHVT
jgi:UMF1 family MFS transporter